MRAASRSSLPIAPTLLTAALLAEGSCCIYIMSTCMLPATGSLHGVLQVLPAHPRLCRWGHRQRIYITRVSERRCLYIPMEDRSDWPALVARVVPLMQAAVDASPGRAPVRARHGHRRQEAAWHVLQAPVPCHIMKSLIWQQIAMSAHALRDVVMQATAARAGPPHRVCVLTKWGSHPWEHVSDPCCSRRPAARLLSRLRRQVTLVAESFGGALALRVAAAAPQLLERLVLVRAPNPNPCAQPPRRRRSWRARAPLPRAGAPRSARGAARAERRCGRAGHRWAHGQGVSYALMKRCQAWPSSEAVVPRRVLLAAVRRTPGGDGYKKEDDCSPWRVVPKIPWRVALEKEGVK